MKKTILSLAVLISLTGCINLTKIMGSWKGAHIDKVVTQWGAPNGRFTKGDGGSVYTWSTLQADPYGASTCRKTFTTNPKGYITRWSYNGCRGAY